LLLQENATEPQDMWFCTMVCLGFRVYLDWINHLLQINYLGFVFAVVWSKRWGSSSCTCFVLGAKQRSKLNACLGIWKRTKCCHHAGTKICLWPKCKLPP
jgi:hypothetical protein